MTAISDKDGKIWMDGKLVEWRDAKVHVLTHTMHYGCGAFEGVRAYETVNGAAIFRMEDHTKRFFNSAKILRMKMPFTQEEMNQAQKEVIRANNLKSCYIRPLVWVGSESLGVSAKNNTVHVMIAPWSWGAYLGEEGLAKGISVMISSFTHHHVNATMTKAKTVSNYTNSILANREATDNGFDEAVMLNPAGYVCEGSGENIFVIKDGVIYTPTTSSGALDGITRNTIIHLAADLGYNVVEKDMTRDELYIADELFFTGTAAEVTPIRAVDRIEIGQGCRGPITEKIQKAFFDLVAGNNEKYAHWLAKV